MVWKEIRNREPEFRNTSNSGICKLSGKQAKVISSVKESRTGMTEIMPVPRKLILLSYQQGASPPCV